MTTTKTWNEGFGELLDQEMMEAFLTLPPLVLIRFNALIQKHIETTIAEEREKIIKIIDSFRITTPRAELPEDELRIEELLDEMVEDIRSLKELN